MILECPACSSKFRVAAEQLGEKGRKVRCGQCGYIWLATLNQDVEAPAPQQQPASSGSVRASEAPVSPSSAKPQPSSAVAEPAPFSSAPKPKEQLSPAAETPMGGMKEKAPQEAKAAEPDLPSIGGEAGTVAQTEKKAVPSMRAAPAKDDDEENMPSLAGTWGAGDRPAGDSSSEAPLPRDNKTYRLLGILAAILAVVVLVYLFRLQLAVGLVGVLDSVGVDTTWLRDLFSMPSGMQRFIGN